MKIKWLGHSCFLIESERGLKVITDPFSVGRGINYSPVEESADVVLVSHDHYDHNAVSQVRGKPEVVKDSGVKSARGIQFRGIDTYHDASQGKQRGKNLVFCFSLDDIKLCHLGDLGHLLGQAQIDEIGAVDILFVPVGGFFTIDAAEAGRVSEQLEPGIIIPMHFKTPKCDYPISGIEDFIRGRKNVKEMSSSEVELKVGDLPAISEIMVLKPAL
ncbi:MAG: MBL fold metallo-hydrolase [Chloroflexota bacterium]|nr:MBL fold metallo-hydrolase [Chloroflexota bacterium]